MKTKRLLVIVAVFAALLTNVCAYAGEQQRTASDNYKPMLVEGRVWKMMDCELSGRGNTIDTIYYSILIREKTVFAGKPCYKAFVVKDGQEERFASYLCEEDSVIYRYSEQVEGWIKVFDFTLKVGEHSIATIDTICVSGRFYRCAYYPASFSDWGGEYVVEGIGSSFFGPNAVNELSYSTCGSYVLSVYDGDKCIFTKDDFTMPSYIPEVEMLQGHPQWICRLISNGSKSYSGFDHIFYINGEKEKNGRIYYDMCCYNNESKNRSYKYGYLLENHVGLREEGGRVYADKEEYLALMNDTTVWWNIGSSSYIPYEETKDGTELVLYDFTMQPGDKFRHLDGYEDIEVISTGTTVTLDGVTRRTLMLSNGYELIEGIGCTNSPGTLLFYLNPFAAIYDRCETNFSYETENGNKELVYFGPSFSDSEIDNMFRLSMKGKRFHQHPRWTYKIMPRGDEMPWYIHYEITEGGTWELDIERGIYTSSQTLSLWRTDVNDKQIGDRLTIGIREINNEKFVTLEDYLSTFHEYAKWGLVEPEIHFPSYMRETFPNGWDDMEKETDTNYSLYGLGYYNYDKGRLDYPFYSPDNELVSLSRSQFVHTSDGVQRIKRTLSNGLVIIEGIGCINSPGTYLFYNHPAASANGPDVSLVSFSYEWEGERVVAYSNDPLYFEIEKIDHTVGVPPVLKTPPSAPTVLVNGNVLEFQGEHPAYTLNIVDNEGNTLFTTEVPESMMQVELPFNLTKDMEVNLLQGSWRIYGRLDPDHETVKVNGINNHLASPSAPIYDLQGRRIQGEPQKGIYLRGGRKYVRK